MARILLIKTAPKNYPFPYSISPPLGLMYIASLLRQKTAHQIKIVDMGLYFLKPEDIMRECIDFDPEIAGISSLSTEAGVLHEVTAAIKEQKVSCRVVAGGPHANACPQDVLKDANIDFLVFGEGELTFLELTEAIISGGQDFQRIKGIAYRKGDSAVSTPPREYIKELDALPFPAWELLPLEKYYKRTGVSLKPRNGSPYMTIATSRGCPYQCIYCHRIMGKAFRPRSAENVLREIESLYRDFNIREYEVLDDCFNLDRERAARICDLIIGSGMKIRLSFPNGLRGDILDEDLLMRLKRAGTFSIAYAVETASGRLQKLIKKNLDLEKIAQVINKTSGLGIHTHGFFMLGFPGETREEMDKTLDFARRSKLDTAGFYAVNPFPNTEIFEMAGWDRKQADFNFEGTTFNNLGFNLSEISDDEFFGFREKCLLIFYLNPVRIVRFLSKPGMRKYLWFYCVLFFKRLFYSSRPIGKNNACRSNRPSGGAQSSTFSKN